MGFLKFSTTKELKSGIWNIFPLLILGSMQAKMGTKYTHTHTLCCAQGAALREKGNSYLYKVVKIPTYIERRWHDKAVNAPMCYNPPQIKRHSGFSFPKLARASVPRSKTRGAAQGEHTCAGYERTGVIANNTPVASIQRDSGILYTLQKLVFNPKTQWWLLI